jgi:catechol 2,3-dioxygenase-like lactoylglutathione lyase family enzyme
MKMTADIMFRAPDLQLVKEYYAGTLGLPIVAETPSLLGFDAGAVTLYFEPGEPNGAVFEFSVPDAQRSKTELLAAGCEVVEENPAIPRIYVRDRFGLLFNVTDEAFRGRAPS